MRTVIQSGAGVLVLLTLVGVARGQNALGDGRALERDLRVGGVGQAPTGNVPRPNFMNEVRARNAAVTGNAPNGQSLQINSPYSSPDDFRGFLSSEDLFSFRRDSLSSAVGYRGTQGLNYQNQFSTGMSKARQSIVTQLDTFGAASDLPRAGTTVRSPADQSVHARPASSEDSITAPRLQNENETPSALTSPLGTLRSTGAFASTLNLTPAVVGFQENEEGGVQRVTASSLLGVRLSGVGNKYSPNQLQRLTDRQLSELPPEKRTDSAAGPDVSPQRDTNSATSPAFRTSYDDLKARLNKIPETPPVVPNAENQPNTTPNGDKNAAPAQPGQARPTDKNTDTIESRIEKLRERLQEGKTRAKPGPQIDTQPKAGQPDAAPGDKSKKSELRPSTIRKGDKYPLAGVDEETLRIIREAGGETKSYTTGDANTLFEATIKAGEDELAKGHYFDAEERFARALGMHPGDVTVQAARLNAQIGAGLYLSAATNLRNLYRDHPEVIGVHYKDATLPSAARVAALMDEFRASIAKAKQEGLNPPEEDSMLLAYVGYQVNDDAAVRDGLAALKKTTTGSADPLVPVLEGVWGKK